MKKQISTAIILLCGLYTLYNPTFFLFSSIQAYQKALSMGNWQNGFFLLFDSILYFAQQAVPVLLLVVLLFSDRRWLPRIGAICYFVTCLLQNTLTYILWLELSIVRGLAIFSSADWYKFVFTGIPEMLIAVFLILQSYRAPLSPKVSIFLCGLSFLTKFAYFLHDTLTRIHVYPSLMAAIGSIASTAFSQVCPIVVLCSCFILLYSKKTKPE